MANNFNILKLENHFNSLIIYFLFKPIGFINSDYKLNIKLIQTGLRQPFRIKIIAKNNIRINKEIIIKYNNNYFRKDNINCLYNTYKANSKNR